MSYEPTDEDVAQDIGLSEEDLSDQPEAGADGGLDGRDSENVMGLRADPPASGWKDGAIVSEVGLVFAFERLREEQDKLEQNRRMQAMERERMDARHQAANERCEKEAAFFENALRVYATLHRAELLGKGKAKTRDFGVGSISYRAQQDAVEVTDARRFATWAQLAPSAVVSAATYEELFPTPLIPPACERLSKSALRAFLKTSEVVPPGVRVTPQEETITIITSIPGRKP